MFAEQKNAPLLSIKSKGIMPIVNLQNVTYKYPLTDAPVLENIDLQVEEGEFVAIIGPNGAGKSTLCYTLSGFIPHFYKGELTGTVEVAGVETQQSTLNEWVLNVGLAFQNPFNQITGAKYTVFEEIAFGLENIGVPRDEMKERVDRALEMTGISDLADRSPYSLSGGQQQRVALTSILVMEPKLLVLDEPTSQMDPIGTREVFGVIRAMAERGMTVVLAEHKTEWIAQFADRVVALHEGKILLEGKPSEVLTSDLLGGKGFGISRYTSTAREAKKQGLWPKERNLPVTLDEAIEGFSLPLSGGGQGGGQS
jgi:energy-coupling factor transporter ATP-binding protein EcfA2